MSRFVCIRPGDDVRVLWCLAFAFLAAAAYEVIANYEPAIKAVSAASEMLYRQSAVNERTVRQSSLLHALQLSAESDLRKVSPERSLAATTAALLTTLETSAKQHRVRVMSIDPVAAASPPKDGAMMDNRLLSNTMTLRIRGHFQNILSFVEDLSRHSTLLKVAHTELALSNAAQSAAEPTLDATVDATLYRLRTNYPSKETDDASGL